MKNPFKKTTKTETTSTVQKLNKTQLEKVVGGTETTIVEPADAETKTGRITFKAKEGATLA